MMFSKQCCTNLINRTPHRHLVPLAFCLSVASGCFIVYASKVSIFDHPENYHGFSNVGITIDCQAFVLPGKILEISFVIVGWIFYLRKGRMQAVSTCYFVALKVAEINLFLLLFHGDCVWLLCTKKGVCVVPSYFDPGYWVPAYLTVQLLSTAVLFLSNKYLCLFIQKSASTAEQKEIFVQYFYWCFETVFLRNQLLGSVLFLMTLSIFLYVILTCYFIIGLKTIYSSPFNLGFLVMGFVTKLILYVLIFVGLKKKSRRYFIACSAVCSLTILLISIAFGAFTVSYINNTYPYKKNTYDKCHFVYLGLLIFSTELFTFRSLWLTYRRFQATKENLPPHVNILPRISQTQLKIGKQLGSGSFGEVCLAEIIPSSDRQERSARNFPTVVAVKRLKSSASEEMKHQFLEEAILMSRFSHRNIVTVVGLCMDVRPISLCMEYFNGGSLESFLQSKQARSVLSESCLLAISLDIAEACHYLETERFIHRDIAARNCLINVDQHNIPVVAKLADFNLTKDVESCKIYQMRNGMIPVGWTAPEGLIWGVFTSKSDVWSFGVLLWEIFSWCAVPYGKCIDPTERHVCSLKAHSNEEILRMLKRAQMSLLDLDDPCSASFSNPAKALMKLCCQFDPDGRPAFETVCQILRECKEEVGNRCNVGPCFPTDRFWSKKSTLDSELVLPVSVAQLRMRNVYRSVSDSGDKLPTKGVELSSAYGTAQHGENRAANIEGGNQQTLTTEQSEL